MYIYLVLSGAGARGRVEGLGGDAREREAGHSARKGARGP